MLDMARRKTRSFEVQRGASPRIRYEPPASRFVMDLHVVLEESGRAPVKERQLAMLKLPGDAEKGFPLYCAGDRVLFKRKAVSIVGTREVTPEGRQRATQLARELVRAGVVVVSGLARGVDTAAHAAAIHHKGQTIAVIGTPLSKAYPSENSDLQVEIYRHHLLVSPFSDGEGVYKSNFPKRNRVMAAISDATVIIEASDTSGTLHQAAECQRLGRWLFIARSVAEDPALTWPSKFLSQPRTAVLTSADDVISKVCG